MTGYVPRPELERQLIASIGHGARGITLVGPGGTGKTRLIQEVLPRDELHEKRNIQFVDVGLCGSEREVCETIAETFGWALSHQRWVESITYQLRQRPRLLLCLDNAESVRDTLNGLIPHWVSSCDEFAVVATSRIPLDYEGEQVFRVPPFGLDSDAELSRGRHLFRDRARMSGHTLEETPEVDAAIEALLLRVSGLPLAIELAATLLRYSSLSHVVEKLDVSITDLEAPSRGPAGTKLSLDACFSRSWDLLNRWEQVALAQISVFSGAFSMEQAESVIATGTVGNPPSPKAIVHSLVNQSLITPTQDQWGSRYVLLHPIRQWTDRKLDALSSFSDTLELETVRVNLTSATAGSAEGDLGLSDKECGLLRYLAERPGVAVTRATLLQEVWGYSESVVSRTVDTTMLTLRKKVDTGEFDHLQTVRGVGYKFLPLPGRFSARLEAQNRHLQWHVQRLNDLWVEGKLSSSPALREFQQCYRRDIAAAVQHAIEQRESDSLEALLRYGLYKGVNYPIDLALALIDIGDTNRPSTRKVIVDFLQLARDYEQVIQWSEDIGEDWEFALQFLIKYNRSQAFFMTGQYPRALALLVELLQTKFPETAPGWPISMIQLRIAMLHNRRGDLADMIDILHRPDLPYRIDQIDVYNNVNGIPLGALVFDLQGKSEQARRFLERTERQAKKENAPRATAAALEQLGLLFHEQARTGRWPDAAGIAEQKFKEALVLYENLWEPWARCSARLTSVYIQQGRLEDADAQLQRTRECASILNDVLTLEQIIEISACELAVRRGAPFELRRSLDRMDVLLLEAPFWFNDIVRHLLEMDYCALKNDTKGLHERVNKTQERVNGLGCHPDFSLAQRLRAVRLRYPVP